MACHVNNVRSWYYRRSGFAGVSTLGLYKIQSQLTQNISKCFLALKLKSFETFAPFATLGFAQTAHPHGKHHADASAIS